MTTLKDYLQKAPERMDVKDVATMQNLANKRIAELEAELKWAWDNMRFTAPPPAEDSEYDFCLVCNRPEWGHDEKCTAKQHKENAEKLLKGNQS